MSVWRSMWLVASVAIAGTTIQPACTREHATGTTANRLIATFRREPKSFNRLVSPNAPENLLTLLTQATLVRVNRVTGELEPRLAEGWMSSPDGLTWTMTLRDGLRFSDGHPFSAADVVFTFRALYDARVASPMASSFKIAGQPIAARASGDRTVVLTFPAPYGPGLRILDSLPILPAHKLEAALAAGTFADAWNVRTPPAEVVGLGPFQLAEYVPGQHLRFTRNPRFWRTDEQGRALPRIDEIDVQIVLERNAEMLRLESGEADLTNDFARAEDLATLRREESLGHLRLVELGVDISPSHLWFNLAKGAPHAKDRRWLQSEELRKAISYAVDRQKIVDTVYLGAAVPIYGPVTPGHKEWYVADLPKTGHDVDRARALLASIGLVDRNGDGTLDDSSGRPAEFSILTQKGDTIRERTASVIQDDLRKVGLKVQILPTDANAIVAKWGQGDYDAIYFGLVSDTIDPGRNLDFWMSSGDFHFWNPGQAKPATEWEAHIDDVMRHQASSLDQAERVRLFAEAQRTLAEHLPILYLAAAKVTVAMNARVQGSTPSVLQPPVLWNSEVLSISSPPRR
jgi:peptide/nickel transport system substrate-binding protein